MTEVETELRRRLSILAPIELGVEDESARHAGHAGAAAGGKHFHVRIVAADFAGRNTLARHRMVFQAAGDLMQQKIHALSVQAIAPDEV